MNWTRLLFLLLLSFLACLPTSNAQKTKLLVTTDLGQDPDDLQSLIRLLHYTDIFEIEGIVLNADSNNNYEAPKLDLALMSTVLDKYAETYVNLKRYGDFTSPTVLKKRIKSGVTGNSVFKEVSTFVGQGFKTEGSDWIISRIDAASHENPLHICLWGGGGDLAQALWTLRQERSPQQLALFLRKFKVYSIGKQDTSTEWMINQFPDLYIILALNPQDNWKSAYRGMFLGGDLRTTSRPWIDEQIRVHNSLAKMYPTKAYTGKNPHQCMKEGDSPSFLFFLKTGLNDSFEPSFGSWGGRFKTTNGFLWEDDMDSFENITDAISTVSRWRNAFQADFHMRVKWGSTSTESENTAPQIIASISQKKVRTGKRISLDAEKSFDAEKNSLSFKWWIYKEASTYKGQAIIQNSEKANATLRIPKNEKSSGLLHLILEVADSQGVTRYKRFEIAVN